MRKGRFAGLGGGPDAVKPLSFVDLLLVDLLPAGGQDDERIGRERVRALGHSAFFLLSAHLTCGVLLLSLAWGTVHFASMLAPFVAVLALDVGFWLATRRDRTRVARPHLVIRLAAGYTLAIGLLWIALVAPALATATPETVVVTRVALAAAFVLPVVAFLPVTALVVSSSALLVAGSFFFYSNPAMLGFAAALGACFAWFSLYTARDGILSANRRLATEWQAEKARRFVQEFEQSGRGWFWETTADGALSYVSDQLAEDFDVSAASLLGHPFADLLRVEEDGTSEPTLGFHLSDGSSGEPAGRHGCHPSRPRSPPWASAPRPSR